MLRSTLLQVSDTLGHHDSYIVILGPIMLYEYSETSIHRFCRGSEKETMDPGKQ
jgi:hypothetical protein